jgi:hypothetical protein
MELAQVSGVPALTGGSNDVDEAQLLAGLSEPQLMVLKLMASGRTLTDAAKGANVTRRTVYQWLSTNDVFIAAHARLRQEMRRAVKMDIDAIAADAFLNVQMAVSSGKDPRLCLALLKYLGLLRPDGEEGARA